MAIDQHQAAKLISAIGHPLLFGNVYVIFMSFQNLESGTANLVSSLVISLVAIPIIWNNLRKMRKGEYSNFDVSDRKQRMGFYPFAIGLFVVLLAVFWALDLPEAVIRQTLVFFVMILTMALINLKIKASMHAGIAFYIAVNIFGIGFLPGLFTFIFSLGVSWSRWELKRHSITELILGALIGVIFGWIGLSL